jgi:hypothetical protein
MEISPSLASGQQFQKAMNAKLELEFSMPQGCSYEDLNGDSKQ